MNKWQKAYSELKAFQSEWYESKFRSYPLALIVGVLIMLVEDKLNEVAGGIGLDEVDDGCPIGFCGCNFKDEVMKWLQEKHEGFK